MCVLETVSSHLCVPFSNRAQAVKGRALRPGRSALQEPGPQRRPRPLPRTLPPPLSTLPTAPSLFASACSPFMQGPPTGPTSIQSVKADKASALGAPLPPRCKGLAQRSGGAQLSPAGRALLTACAPHPFLHPAHWVGEDF